MLETPQGVTKDDNCDEIQGISVPSGVNNITDVSMFESEATICATIKGGSNPTILPTQEVSDLKAYLARPILWRSGTFATAPGPQETIYLNTVANLTNFIGTQALSRMEGAKGFRATICVKLVVTATPFHQGICAMAFQYGVSTLAFNGNRLNFPYLTTNLPHVKLDIAEETSAELRIPWISHCEYFPVNVTAQDSFNNNYGAFGLSRLSTFRLAASQLAARYSIYTWLEDVELIGAYPFSTTSVNLQSGDNIKATAKKVSSHAMAAAKAYVGDRLSPAHAELRKSGLISKGLDTVSKVAGYASYVPGLSAIAGPTAWFTRVASKAASAFGYSKPADETIVQRVVPYGYVGDSHIDIPTPAFKAAPFQSNTVAVGNVGATDEDEMAIDYILSKPAMIYRKTFSTTANVGDLVYAGIVSPSCMWYRDNAGGGNIAFPATATLTTSCFAPSHFCYIGSGFRYWRGSFKYIFQFSKSKMHAGRVLISFVPGTSENVNAPISSIQDIPTASSAGVQMTGYSKMFDLRDSSVVEFEVPYIHQAPYTLYTGTIGTISMQVVSPLNAPGNAADTIDMLVYVAGQPGFEFAMLKPSMLDATNFRSDQTASGVYLQAGGVDTTEDASQFVIGERFTSVKQVAMVPDWHVFDQINNTFINFTLTPWFKRDYLPIIVGGQPISNTAQTVWYGSKCGRMQEMYAFTYGSAAWTVITDDPDGAATGISVFTAPTDGNSLVTGNGSLYNYNLAGPNGQTIYENRGSLRVVVPAWGKYQRIPHQVYYQGTSPTLNTAPVEINSGVPFITHYYTARVRNNTGATRRVAVGKAAADDATMGQYIGPPLVNLFQSTATVAPNASTLPF